MTGFLAPLLLLLSPRDVHDCINHWYFLSENMIRGLDSDETLFLDLVSKQQEEIASRRFNEETQEIREYRVC